MMADPANKSTPCFKILPYQKDQWRYHKKEPDNKMVCHVKKKGEHNGKMQIHLPTILAMAYSPHGQKLCEEGQMITGPKSKWIFLINSN